MLDNWRRDFELNLALAHGIKYVLNLYGLQECSLLCMAFSGLVHSHVAITVISRVHYLLLAILILYQITHHRLLITLVQTPAA